VANKEICEMSNIDEEKMTEWVRERWEGVDLAEPDPIVATVIKRMRDRSTEGMKKYGCTMDRDDLTVTQWIDHAIEELLDAAVYMEKLKKDIGVLTGGQ
jgi:hypothetical protein